MLKRECTKKNLPFEERNYCYFMCMKTMCEFDFRSGLVQYIDPKARILFLEKCYEALEYFMNPKKDICLNEEQELQATAYAFRY